MPMVRMTKLRRMFAAVIAIAALHGQSGLAEDSRQSAFDSPNPLTFSNPGGEGHSFAFGYSEGSDGLILGGSVATGQTGPLTRALQVEETHQLRLHAGYDFGPATGFVTVGGLQAEDSGRRRLGTLFGFGMRISLNRALQLTGELLHHEAGPRDGSGSPRGETLAVGAAFRF
ncbi:membrane protein [Leisingera sp. ANG-M7]|nr:membrane protein [Leisingera sp. ANG-M7]